MCVRLWVCVDMCVFMGYLEECGVDVCVCVGIVCVCMYEDGKGLIWFNYYDK